MFFNFVCAFSWFVPLLHLKSASALSDIPSTTRIHPAKCKVRPLLYRSEGGFGECTGQEIFMKTDARRWLFIS